MPFAGRDKNGSETLARYLAAQDLPYNVNLCILDVVWGAPGKELLPLVDNLQPDLIVGLGEGPGGFIGLETVGVNLRDGTDNNGEYIESAPIEPGGPDQREARFDFQYTCSQEIFRPLMISRNAGRFLCNEHLYVCAGTDVPKVVFLHLPPQGDVADERYVTALAPTITWLIEQNL